MDKNLIDELFSELPKQYVAELIRRSKQSKSTVVKAKNGYRDTAATTIVLDSAIEWRNELRKERKQRELKIQQ